MLTFGAAVSTAPDHTTPSTRSPAALERLGGTPDLVVCFFSMEHAPAAAGIALSLCERPGTSTIVGCTAQGVIGDGRELEGVPGLTVWMARLPGVDVRPFSLRCCRWRTRTASAAGPTFPMRTGPACCCWPTRSPSRPTAS